ncbi:glycoside hydrolase family 53 protein [Polaribacter sp. M15]
MKIYNSLLFKLTVLLTLCLLACSSNLETTTTQNTDETEEQIVFLSGADLSYANEMEDCGVIYKNKANVTEDVFQIFKNNGANIVRVRQWHSPNWTNYSNQKDVEKSIKRAKNSKMAVLLDFHYSDDWADPNQQIAPKAWLPIIDNLPILGDSIYNYTYKTLKNLSIQNLLPEIVQIGNEINIMILQKDNTSTEMNWYRNAYLLNKGIQAVRDIAAHQNKKIDIMLHIAQPENGLWWFEQAKSNGIIDFDWIGLSYYPKWSKYNLNQVSEVFKTLKELYKKKVMVVETAYPFTLENADDANNILGKDAIITGYEATQQGQLNYLSDLKKAIKNGDGLGLIYWEPAWVSNNCSTRWGKGSHWDNATLFDKEGKPTLGMNFYNSN